MRFGFNIIAVMAFLSAFSAIPVAVAEVLTLNATEGRFKVTFYPDYFLFLKGIDASIIETAWVDKEYYAVLDMHEGPEKGRRYDGVIAAQTPADHRRAQLAF